MESALLHGGNLQAARRLFPDAPEPFIDLSTGVNPHSYPVPKLSSDVFAHLPEPAALDRLAATAATVYGAPSRHHVVPAPGTQILLPLVMALRPPGRAAVLGPTYEEFSRVARLAGHEVAEVGDIGQLKSADLAVVVNPNNPDGWIFNKRELLDLADARRHREGLLVIDEAFMDVGPVGTSLCGEVARGDIVVLRSFGKFFGLGGLRLGFALAAPNIAARLAAALGPWAVAGPAIAIGQTALADAGWSKTMRERLEGEARRLDAVLVEAGIEVVGGTSLFRLVRTPVADRLFLHLGRAGILVRRFPDHPAWLRIGLPGSEAAWDRLRVALVTFSSSHRSLAEAPNRTTGPDERLNPPSRPRT
ncbi:MAG TPA: threonine-phosphate decarboxylase CobD [Xanthobacteraceae bacterium]|nr:threonine-phosphate decarboxylase CobD [Xanthobacteraceae bacterium]